MLSRARWSRRIKSLFIGASFDFPRAQCCNVITPPRWPPARFIDVVRFHKFHLFSARSRSTAAATFPARPRAWMLALVRGRKHLKIATLTACVGREDDFVGTRARSQRTTVARRAAAALHRIAKEPWRSIRAIDHAPLQNPNQTWAERSGALTSSLDKTYVALISTRRRQINLTWIADQTRAAIYSSPPPLNEAFWDSFPGVPGFGLPELPVF